jgi:FkbM family methyltransferase
MKPAEMIQSFARHFPWPTKQALHVLVPRTGYHWLSSKLVNEFGLSLYADTRLHNGLMMRVRIGDNVGDAIRSDRNFESESLNTVLNRLTPDSVFFDIGAHMGLYTLHAAPRCKAVHCFEPVPGTNAVLSHNVQSNKLFNVKVCNFALSDADGEVEMFEGSADNLGASSLAASVPAARVHRIKTRSLDSYVSETGAIPDVIKMDVEGAEILVLRGARKLLMEHHPAILCEFGEAQQQQFGFSVQQLSRTLEDLGYQISPITNEIEQRSYYNVLATKKATSQYTARA